MKLRPSVAALSATVVGAAACTPIEPRPLVDPPLNTCPCDRFEPGATTAPRCSERNRCEILTAGGRPEYPFWIVVHVPDSSIFAPGATFVLSGDAAFKEPTPEPGVIVRCRPSQGCLLLGGIVGISGSYFVTSEVSEHVGYPLADGASIPVRVVYEPLRNLEEEIDFPRLPLDRLFASSSLITSGERKGQAVFSRPIPEGQYRRVYYPQPPFDERFPPRADVLDKVKADFLVDDVFLDGNKLESDPTRVAKVTREAGLDGWRVWLEARLPSATERRRISVVRRLSGTEDEQVLYTSIGTGIGNEALDVHAVVAPPESWSAVPRYVTSLPAGSGLQALNYPPIPPPVPVEGVVALPTTSATDPLLGYAARITFESTDAGLTTDRAVSAPESDLSPLLRYSTTLSTDDRGRFATVLPPGEYVATIEPAEGTGHATHREYVTVGRSLTTRTFQPPPRTPVKGRAVLTDGRALSDAEVIAIPHNVEIGSKPTASSGSSVALGSLARPSRTHTSADGTFSFELDPGSYFLTVVPKAGTGFPRVVTRPVIPSSPTELPEIRVPAPTRLAFELRHPSPLTPNFIQDAIVRVFARPAGATDPRLAVEIGSGMTDKEGKVEILLAQEPR